MKKQASLPGTARARGRRSMPSTRGMIGLSLGLLTGLVAAGAGAVVQRCWALEPPGAVAAEKSPQKPKQQTRLDQYGDPLPEGAVARLGSLRLYHGAVDLRQ